jgi:ubiquinone/menaquinone biosynthesis C-methylase UbiE
MDILEQEQQWMLSRGSEMVQDLGINSDDVVVDFGCGIGRYVIPLSQAVGENGAVLAIERTSEDIETLKERVDLFGRASVVQVVATEDAQLLSVSDASVDSLLAFDVLQYIENWTDFFESVARVLKRSGMLHVYPAVGPHPGAVDVERMVSVATTCGLSVRAQRRFVMMHNKDLLEDEVYTFNVSTSLSPF